MADGLKLCLTCGIPKPLSEFYGRITKGGLRSYSSPCKECKKAAGRVIFKGWYANPDNRSAHIKNVLATRAAKNNSGESK